MLFSPHLEAQERFTQIVKQYPFSLNLPQNNTSYHTWVHVALLHPQAPVIRSGYFLGLKKGKCLEATVSGNKLNYLGSTGYLQDAVFDVFDAEGKLLFADAEDCILTGAAFFDVAIDSQYSANVLYRSEVFERIGWHPDSVLSGNERSITPYDALVCFLQKGKRFVWDPILKRVNAESFFPEKRMDEKWWKGHNGSAIGIYEIGKGMLKGGGWLEVGAEIVHETFAAKTMKGWGLYHLKEKWIIPPQFNDLFFANDSMVIVLSGGVWKTEEHVRTITQETSMRGSVYTHEERTVDTVLSGQKAGLFRLDGKKILNPVYDYILVLNHLVLGCHAGTFEGEESNALPQTDLRFERYALWLSQHWRGIPVCDVYSKKGKLLFKKSLLTGLFEEKNPESNLVEYRLAMQVKGKEGLLDDKGKPIVPFSFSSIQFYSAMHRGNMAEVIVAKRMDTGIQLYSGSGKLLSEKIFSSAMPLIRPMQDHELAGEDVFVMVMGIGRKNDSPQIESVTQEEFGAVANDQNAFSGEKFLIIDPFGAVLSREPLDGLEYDSYYGEFLARVGNKFGRLGLSGSWIVPPVYSDIRPVRPGVYIVSIGEQMGLYAHGFELTPEFEQMYWVGSDVFMVVRQGMFGLFNLTSKSFLIEPDFDFIYKLDERYLLCGKEQKKGIVDFSGQTIIPLEFDGIDLAPPGFSLDIVRIESNGKIGFFSLSKRQMVTEPVLDFVSPIAESGRYFRCLQGGQMEFNAMGELIALRYAKYGIIDSSGKIIVPPVYTDVSPFAEDIQLFRAVGPQGEVFFNRSGVMIPKNEATAQWKKSLLYAVGNSKKTNAWTVNEKKGIHVIHPSSFFLEAKGKYWVGTNGSGVWYTENAGNSWIQRSYGIGNTRVLLLEEWQDTLFCLHHPLYEVNDISTIGQTANLSFWDKTQSSWISIDRRIPDVFGYEIFPFADSLFQKSFARDSIARHHATGQPNLITSFRNLYDYFGEHITAYIPNPDAVQFTTMHGTDTLWQGIPKDIFPCITGNLFIEDTICLLISDGGIYRLDALRQVSVLPTQNVETGKISKIVEVKDVVYALENNADIWQFSSGKWKKCFDHYESFQGQNAQGFPLLVSSFVKTQSNSVLFCASGNVYELAENRAPKVVVQSGGVSELFSEGYNFPDDVFIITHAIEDAQHELWCYGFFRNAEGENEHERLGFFRWNNKVKKLEWRNDGLYFSFASNPVFLDNGKLLLENQLIDLFSHDTLLLPPGEFAWDVSSADQLAFAPDGKMALLLSPQLIAIYDPNGKTWQRIPNFGIKLKGIAFDSKGSLFAWTDYAYSAFETKVWQEEQKPSFYCFEMQTGGFVWREVPIPGHPRVLSFHSFANGTMWVGTDGAGVFEIR